MTHALAKICLGSMFFGGVLWIGTAADASVTPFSAPFRHGGGSGNGSGNGKHNHNVFIIDSPNQSHDVQHVRDVNAGGNTITPTALCKHPGHNCKIIQKVWVDFP